MKTLVTLLVLVGGGTANAGDYYYPRPYRPERPAVMVVNPSALIIQIDEDGKTTRKCDPGLAVRGNRVVAVGPSTPCEKPFQ